MTITLKTLPNATAQEVFDHVTNHLLTQNEKSGTEYGGCDYYQSSTGFRCAAGCLIAEDEYTINFEGQNWGGLVLRGHVPEQHSKLIQDLQDVHDDIPVEKWRVRLQDVAAHYDLNWNFDQ